MQFYGFCWNLNKYPLFLSKMAISDTCPVISDICLVAPDRCLAIPDRCPAAPDICLVVSDRCLAISDICLAIPDRCLPLGYMSGHFGYMSGMTKNDDFAIFHFIFQNHPFLAGAVLAESAFAAVCWCWKVCTYMIIFQRWDASNCEACEPIIFLPILLYDKPFLPANLLIDLNYMQEASGRCAEHRSSPWPVAPWQWIQ